MATIKPFKAVRPKKEYAEKIATLPYDVFSEKEAREAVKKNPRSFLKIVRPETAFPEGTDMYSDEVYEKANELLKEEIGSGIFFAEDTECFYIYRQTMRERSQTGIVGCFAVDDYLNNVIKKHELTRHDKELDRTKHINACSAQTGGVFLAFSEKYDMGDIIDNITTREPLYDFFSLDMVRQTVWKVDDPQEVAGIAARFAEMDSLYVADGHHRCASAAAVAKMKRAEDPDYDGTEEYNYFLAVAFSQNQLKIYPYNRVMDDLNGMTDEEFLSRIPGQGFRVEPIDPKFYENEKRRDADKIEHKHEIAMYLSGKWYRLFADPSILKDDPVGALETSMLHDNILEPLLGVTDERADKRVDFIGGVRAFSLIEQRCNEDMKVGFALYPTTMDELFRVTDAGLIMPPKSTWFEPKLQSGLFVHMI